MPDRLEINCTVEDGRIFNKESSGTGAHELLQHDITINKYANVLISVTCYTTAYGIEPLRRAED